MTRWLEYDYLIVSQPREYEFPALTSGIMGRIEMSPRGQWFMAAEADAMIIVLKNGKGLSSTRHPDCFAFDGSRPTFEAWISRHHPQAAYAWLDQYVIAFADRAAQLSFNGALGWRVLRSAHMPRCAQWPNGQRDATARALRQ